MSNFTQVVEYFNTTEICRRIKNESISIIEWHVRPTAIIEKWEAVVIFIATGIFAMLLAFAFEYIKHNVHMSTDDLDSTFDAGGNVNAGLTATTIVSQWTWSASLLQSTTVTAKYGISGAFWYAAGASIQIILFSMLAVQLKIRAPGAKTFLQVIKARFGDGTHIVFCIFALVTNIIVTCMLMLGGGAVITTLVHDMSLEYALALVAGVIGGYTFVGGLGATIYVSYFNSSIVYVILLVLIFKVYEDEHSEFSSIGSISKVYDYVSCAKGPDGNDGNSYLTFISENGLMFGITNIVGNFGTVFVDQSYWQSAVAAKPKQGAIGFILAGLAWFAIPFSLSTAMGLGYIAMSAEQGCGLLTMKSINEGLVVPTVVSRLLGKTGAFLVLVMLLMAITSTGAAEVMAVTSILIYDVYAPYVKPFRAIHHADTCILCGKAQGSTGDTRDPCRCISFNYCAHCAADTKARQECRRAIKPSYTCGTHGLYRVYSDKLNGLKSWAFVWVNMSIIPLTLILDTINVGLSFTYSFMGVVIGSAVVPITLSMFWEKLTATAMVTGAVSATCLSLVSWVAGAAIQEGGLGNFRENAGKERVMLVGNLVAILFGGLTTFVVTILQHEDMDSIVIMETWEDTRDIDNPLAPWTDVYKEELGVLDVQHLNNRPSLKNTQMRFAKVMVFAKRMSIFSLLFILLVVPVILTDVGIMNLWEFTAWIKLSQVWATLAAVSMIIIPFGIEAWDIDFTMHKPRIKKSELLGSQEYMVSCRPSICATTVSTERIDGTDDDKPTIHSETGSYFLSSPYPRPTTKSTNV